MKESGELPEVSRDVREILEGLEKGRQEGLGIYERFCRFSNELVGSLTKNWEMTEETRKEIAWAKLKVTPAEWWAGFLVIILAPIITTVVFWIGLFASGMSLLSYWYLPALGLTLSALLGSLFYYYPISLADIERTEAQSRAIETIMLMSFALHHRPDLRGAAIFAGNASEGKLADDIRQGLLELDQKRSYETVRQMFMVIAHRWRDIDQGVRRAIFDILRSTGQSEESLRRQDVAQAPERVIENLERQLGSKLDSVVMPTMTFMVFGSLAIVGIIGLSPIFGMIGMNFINIEFFALVAGALVVSFLAFTVFIERRRPVTLPPPKIPSSSPGIPPEGMVEVFERLVPAWIPALLVFILVSFPGFLYLSGTFVSYQIISGPNTFWIIWGGAGAVSLYTYLRVGPRAELREKVRKAVEDWTLALSIMGSRILDGRPMKQAMKEASEMMPETTVGKQLGQATSTMDRFSVDPNYAFFETGIAKEIHSPLVMSFLGIITLIKKGSEKAAGRASMMAAEFLDTLKEVEMEFKEKTSDATGNLWLMGIVLLPVVCALSVWVMDFMGEISITTSSAAGSAGLSEIPILTGFMEPREIALLKMVMGATVIALVMVIVRHVAVIESGRDQIKFWNLVPGAVLGGTIVFTLAYLGFGLLNVIGA